MENEQHAYTVEFQDNYGVLYFENVKAVNQYEAKMEIIRKFPDVYIRAVSENETMP
ncbi:hypothetical protein [Marinicrinis lubricantis]|uniref:Uncharacterized protein n=1 Tax=Marinicrinis lubricantis TaxID=2086470 RepID=A0ABW1IKY6_9BACL